ncbi:hypothetical protein QFC22_000483 [Naganishia vaughanmartiniae]|uniref:Uncharacterized protein n=1 Tax=Naganishia vaughanmartiniae TaxID=1424756 RepID=A0ACC2XS40_9TREE|nr:hypothetical protein QFC22_000483 [Naganishia vaughanmartiniae]
MNNFLPIPPKVAEPLPELGDKIRLYIQDHFNDTHPDAFKHDIAQLGELRKKYVEGSNGPEVHHEVVTGLSNFNSDPTISLSSITYERAAVLYNIAAVYASLGAAENRSEIEGIKRALAYTQNAAGVLSYIRTNLLPTLEREQSSASGIATAKSIGQDMTSSFIGALEKFCLAEAQECFWQRAVIDKYKNGLIAKLAMQVAEFYASALANSAEGLNPTAHYFPAAWTSHVTVKRYHFEAAAQYRLSMDDLEKGRYGDEIARLQLAETLAKKALDAVKPGLSTAVSSDLRSLQGILASSLKRAVRDNDLVYVQPIPPVAQLASITPAAMVKPVTPASVENSLEWLMHEGGGALFSGLVPYGVHLALSIYDDRKDTLVRTELHGKREELDALAATTLQSLGLPGSITALERPTSLPPALLQKAEEVQMQGGIAKVQALLQEVTRVAKYNANTLEEVFDILDQEAMEEEMLHERYADIDTIRQSSHQANAHLVEQAEKYRATLTQAKKSDGDVLLKWQEWVNLIGILAGGEDALERHIPSSGRGNPEADITPTIRSLRSLLEDLEDVRNHRARLVAEAQRVVQQDDIRSLVVQEAARLAHGGSGDVQTEWFENIFEKELAKYHRLIEEMQGQQAKQERLLANIRAQNDIFVHEKQEDARVKHREKKLQEMEMAYWKWREIVGNCEEGIRFYNGFAELLVKFKESVQSWVYGPRVAASAQGQEARSPAQHEETAPSAPSETEETQYPAQEPQYHFQPAPTLPSAPAFTLPPPDSSAWQSAEDFLPPPPPAHKPSQHVPSREVPTHALSQVSLDSAAAPSRRKSTRSSRAPDTEENPFQARPSRRKGGGVV